MKIKSHFNLLDIITAFICLGILISVVLQLTIATQKASKLYEAEAEATRIFDNVLEQLKDTKNLNNELISNTFLYEYSRSSLLRSKKFKTKIDLKNNRVILLILKENGKTLAKLKI